MISCSAGDTRGTAVSAACASELVGCCTSLQHTQHADCVEACSSKMTKPVSHQECSRWGGMIHLA